MSTAAEQARTLYGKHGEKLRYLVVGVWNTALSFVVFGLAINFLAVPIEHATNLSAALVAVILQWCVWVLMVVQSTVMMKYFAFRSKGRLGPQIVKAYFVYLPAQAISSVILWGTMALLAAMPLTSHLSTKADALIGQALAVMIGTIFSYFGHKYFTFRTPLEVGEVPPQDMVDPEGARQHDS